MVLFPIEGKKLIERAVGRWWPYRLRHRYFQTRSQARVNGFSQTLRPSAGPFLQTRRPEVCRRRKSKISHSKLTATTQRLWTEIALWVKPTPSPHSQVFEWFSWFLFNESRQPQTLCTMFLNIFSWLFLSNVWKQLLGASLVSYFKFFYLNYYSSYEHNFSKS